MSPPAIKSTGDPVWSPLHARSTSIQLSADFDAFALVNVPSRISSKNKSLTNLDRVYPQCHRCHHLHFVDHADVFRVGLFL